MSAALSLASTIPAPPPVKACKCGRSYDAAEWAALPYVGRMPLTDETDCDIRNCACGSSISVESPRLTELELRANGVREQIAQLRRHIDGCMGELAEHVVLGRECFEHRQHSDAWGHLRMAGHALHLARRDAREAGHLHAYLVEVSR